MRVNTRAEQIVRNRKIMLVVFIFAIIATAFVLFSARAAAEDSRPVYEYCTSYEVQPGDTLWTIADHFMGPYYTDKQTFISNVKQLNHLGDDNITAGNYLVIEYSSYEKL